ncbi:MAG: glutamate--tRNA ligase [Kiritimatiellia bacterium]|nr:glutamate--tRNA ligase [Lentisphaerota bacterium]
MNQETPGAAPVRTRVAPSPTGAPHIGTAYIALFNYAFAKHHGGQFILRIEDTDQTRSTAASEQAILDALRWIGIPWDEGPDRGGAHAPYRQSARTDIYLEHVRKLTESGAAYPCFCTAARLAELRRSQAGTDNSGYDGCCATLDPAQAARRAAAGEPHVVRLRIPTDGECVMQDRLRGAIRIPWHKVDHQVLLKSDGYPTYHLANVVDDHLMGISHVIRGEEWLSSLPKHLLLYQAFQWQAPEFVHLPLLRNPDKSKLSKRRNPTSILYYQRAGFLPEALINYLGLLAYSFPDGREEFTLAQLAENFDIDRVSLGGPIFDLQKLRNFNGRYLRGLPPAELWHRLQDWLLRDEVWQQIVPLAQPRLSQMTDLVPQAAFLFADRLDYAPDQLIKTAPGGDAAALARLLKTAQWEMEKLPEWDNAAVRDLFNRLATVENLKLKQLMPPFYVAVTGAPVGLPAFDAMVQLGRDMTLRRLQYALETLETGGVALKGRQLKEFTAAYQAAYGSPA